MNILMIVGIFALLAVAGFAVAGSFESEVAEEILPTCGSASCDGNCNAESSCSSASCGASIGKSCDCGRS